MGKDLVTKGGGKGPRSPRLRKSNEHCEVGKESPPQRGEALRISLGWVGKTED